MLLSVIAGLIGLLAGWLLWSRAERWTGPAVASRAVAYAGGAPDAPVPAPEHGPLVPRPVAALATGALCALAALRFGLAWQLGGFLFLAAVGVLLAVIDLRHRLLPDLVVLPSVVAGAALLGLAALAEGDGTALLRAVLGSVALFVAFFALALLAPSGLGMGDVKLAALLGLYLGWLGPAQLVLGAVAGFVVQAAVALVLLASRRVGLRSELPFGPAMLVGAAVVIGFGRALFAG